MSPALSGLLCTWAVHVTAVGARISMSPYSEGCQRNGLLGLPDVQWLISSRRWAANGGPQGLREEGRVMGNTVFQVVDLPRD